MPEPTAEFLKHCELLGIAFEPGDLGRLGRYLDLLFDANTRFNLTAITDPDQAWMRHIFDSLTLVPLIVSAEAGSLIDVGSGGGLPGLPLAIVMPGLRVTLLEATGKKAAFLSETARALELPNVEVIKDRAETAGRDSAHRERYDIATARAVGRLDVLLELTSPFIKVGGLVLAIKGGKAPEEASEAKQALHRLHCRLIELLPTATGTIVAVQKDRPTPKAYPRRPGEPKRAPLR